MRFLMEDGHEPDALCADCGDGVYAEELHAEGWERFGALLCPECLEERCLNDGEEDEEESDDDGKVSLSPTRGGDDR